jgi:hypothetical protein
MNPPLEPTPAQSPAAPADSHDALRQRWLGHAAAAFDLMFHPDYQADLVTLDQREQRVVGLMDDLGGWLLTQQVNADPDARPPAEQPPACPRCGKPAPPRDQGDSPPPTRTVTTSAGEVQIRRTAYRCTTCRVVFFPPGP